ncbi:MAG: hypothetical protein ACLFVC_03425 [Opitutales bacterium]
MFKFLPWRFFVKRAARHYGVLDPSMLLARMRRFAQPSEVAEPLELLRAGIVFHARGLVNSKAIQHNLDWVWPYWVERQFNPESRSFIPRAFSFSHINLTHRNWTAVGLPGLAAYPIVDPRGLVTPLEDGWSLDFWIITEGDRLLPSKLEDEAVRQQLVLEPSLEVRTDCAHHGLRLELATRMQPGDDLLAEAVTRVRAESDVPGWLVAAVRPYNPEGVQFINRIAYDPPKQCFHVNDEADVAFDQKPETLRMAHYAEGDVYLDLEGSAEKSKMSCDVGMATAAALFRLEPGRPRKLEVSVGLGRDLKDAPAHADASLSWADATADCAKLQIPDERMRFLYDAAVHTLILLSADDLVPGPYTYRRFWFRDACLMLHPLIALGEVERATRILKTFPARQTMGGYFSSQEGEWDSNGQVLWIAARYVEMTGRPLDDAMETALRSAVGWLERKRLTADPKKHPAGTAGLLPAGFSAEHLGPNDYYYWDDFWAWAGLAAIARHWETTGDIKAAGHADGLAREFEAAIRRSIDAIPESRAKGAIPAAPGRRLDAGAIGSMVADYPLHLYPPAHSRILRTNEFLMERCFHRGGFFQEMIHSGINAYLTLDLAQTLLRAGDPRFEDLMRQVADLASPTGQWPEAIHSLTLGGCMGDGQHGWAAAEWIMMIRNCFVREESDHLVIGSGILSDWIEHGDEVRFGPTLTAWGSVDLRLKDRRLELDCDWRGDAPRIVVAVPGHAATEEQPLRYRLHPETK